MKARLGRSSAVTLAVVFTGSMLSSAVAHADPIIAADLDYVLPVDDDGVSSSFGVALRVGQELEGAGASLTPELGVSYNDFAGPLNVRTYRGYTGFRFGVGEVVRPGLFGHAGIGHIRIQEWRDIPTASETAFTFDVGAFIDFHVIENVNFGVHGAYNRIAKGDDFPAFRWGSFGLHGGLLF